MPLRPSLRGPKTGPTPTSKAVHTQANCAAHGRYSEAAAKILADKIGRENPEDHVTPFGCVFCKGWHLGRPAPLSCVACGGSGQNSKGTSECAPCRGTGVRTS